MDTERGESISATELAKLGLCELRLHLDATRGQGIETQAIAQRKARGNVVHARALEAARQHPGHVDRRCFIATAVYGPDAPETVALRAWRDATLRTHGLGRAFIRGYYALSPAVARWIETRPWAVARVRGLLDVLVRYLRAGGP